MAKPNKNNDSKSNNSRRPKLIAGIGASAGGLAAFSELLSNLPSDTGLAFVLLPHLDPTHKSAMKDLLTQKTSVNVCEAQEGQEVEADRVYILEPAHGLTIVNGKLHLAPLERRKHRWKVVSQFLNSLAADQQERAVGIILSGTGQHGITGLKEVKQAGGFVMAQSPDSCQHPQMPQSAIDAGLVDLTVEPAEIPAALVYYADHHALADQPAFEEIPPEQIDSILSVLRNSSRFDFRSYRKNMLTRRILRRMAVCHLFSVANYQQRLREDQMEVEALIRDLLIGVTAFFRDPMAFKVLQQQVLPELVEH